MGSNAKGSLAHVLVVDDHRGVARALTMVLERAGYRVSAAYDGMEGLQKAVAERPDLVILDIDMPILDGYEVARRLISYPETAHIPIIMLTVKGRTEHIGPGQDEELDRRVRERILGYESGAVEFLSKPVTAARLLEAVRAVLAVLGEE
ncbi:MAG: response regulator [Chloroflexi bacterium]|nr:response regulator [Chloroflexota bacterium]